MFGRLLRWYTIYSLSGDLAPWQNFARCKIHFACKSSVLPYCQCYCTALEQWASAEVCGFQQRALPIFGRAAITLEISPHSSYRKIAWVFSRIAVHYGMVQFCIFNHRRPRLRCQRRKHRKPWNPEVRVRLRRNTNYDTARRNVGVIQADADSVTELYA